MASIARSVPRRGLHSCAALAAMLIVAALATTPCARCLDNGMGLRPALGFNTWNAFGTKSALMHTADWFGRSHAVVLHFFFSSTSIINAC